MKQEEVEAVEAALREARVSRRAIEAPSKTWPGLTEEAAMEVQKAGLARAVREGDRLAGYKLGNIAKVMQEAFGLDRPDYGFLLASTFAPEGGALARADYIAPYAELEVGFILGPRGLRGPGVTVPDVIAAVEWAVPAVEIIDSRVRDWAIDLPDTLADNGSAGAVVVGGCPRRLDQLRPSPADLRGRLRRDGREVAAGNTRNVLGNPLAAVAWLANRLAAYGLALEPGQFVLPGSCLEAVRIDGPGHWSASFDGWATIEFDIT